MICYLLICVQRYKKILNIVYIKQQKIGTYRLKVTKVPIFHLILYTLTGSFFNIRNGYKEAYRHIRQDYTYTRMQSSASSVLFPATGSPLYFA